MIRARIVDAMVAQRMLRRRRAGARILLWLVVGVLDGVFVPQEGFLSLAAFCGCMFALGRWGGDYSAWDEGFSDGWAMAHEKQKAQARP
jgi:hypothetical protein